MTATPSVPPPRRPLLTRWWVWCLLASGVVLGVWVVSNWPVWASNWVLGGVPLPDAILLAPLWTLANPYQTLALIFVLAAAGGLGFGRERIGGPRGRLAGVVLSCLLVLAVAAGTVVGSRLLGAPLYYRYSGLFHNGDWVGWVGGLCFLAVWVWASEGRRWALAGRAAFVWLLVALPAALVSYLPGLRLQTHLDKVFPEWLVAQGLVGLLPAICLLWLFPTRKRLLGMGVWPVAVAALALVLALPQLVPPGRPGLPEDFYTDPQRDGGSAFGESANLVTWVAAGTEYGKFSFGYRMASAEGIASRLPPPPAGFARYTGHSSASVNYITMKDDRINLPASRQYLLDLLATDPTLIDALVYGVLISSDPFACREEAAALPGLVAAFPAFGGFGGKVAEFAYKRGEIALGDALVEAAWPTIERAEGLRIRAGLCPDEPGGCGEMKWIGQALHRRAWPLFTGPYEGEVGVFLDTSSVPEIGDDLLLSLLPLPDPDMPLWKGDGELVGSWDLRALTQLHPATQGENLLSSLPVAQYALELAFRDYLHPGLEVWVVGMPREEIDIGPGHWEWETSLTLLPQNPLPFTCGAGALRWEAFPGARSYLVEAWGRGQGNIRNMNRLAIQVVTETTLPLTGFVEAGDGWPFHGFRVVPLDGEGKEIIRADPLSFAALRSVWLQERECMAEPVAPRDFP